MYDELWAQIQNVVEELKRVSVLLKHMLIANASSPCARVPSQQQNQYQRSTCLQIQADLHRIHTHLAAGGATLVCCVIVVHVPRC